MTEMEWRTEKTTELLNAIDENRDTMITFGIESKKKCISNECRLIQIEIAPNGSELPRRMERRSNEKNLTWSSQWRLIRGTIDAVIAHVENILNQWWKKSIHRWHQTWSLENHSQLIENISWFHIVELTGDEPRMFVLGHTPSFVLPTHAKSLNTHPDQSSTVPIHWLSIQLGKVQHLPCWLNFHVRDYLWTKTYMEISLEITLEDVWERLIDSFQRILSFDWLATVRSIHHWTRS